MTRTVYTDWREALGALADELAQTAESDAPGDLQAVVDAAGAVLRGEAISITETATPRGRWFAFEPETPRKYQVRETQTNRVFEIHESAEEAFDAAVEISQNRTPRDYPELFVIEPAGAHRNPELDAGDLDDQRAVTARIGPIYRDPDEPVYHIPIEADPAELAWR